MNNSVEDGDEEGGGLYLVDGHKEDRWTRERTYCPRVMEGFGSVAIPFNISSPSHSQSSSKMLIFTWSQSSYYYHYCNFHHHNQLELKCLTSEKLPPYSLMILVAGKRITIIQFCHRHQLMQ